MKNVLAVFAAIGLVAAAEPAKAQASLEGMDISWGIRATPEIRPDAPDTRPCARSFNQQACLYYLQLLREHGYKVPNPTDFIATPCQATPQPLVDWQSGTTRPVPETVPNCADDRTDHRADQGRPK